MYCPSKGCKFWFAMKKVALMGKSTEKFLISAVFEKITSRVFSVIFEKLRRKFLILINAILKYMWNTNFRRLSAIFQFYSRQIILKASQIMIIFFTFQNKFVKSWENAFLNKVLSKGIDFISFKLSKAVFHFFDIDMSQGQFLKMVSFLM